MLVESLIKEMVELQGFRVIAVQKTSCCLLVVTWVSQLKLSVMIMTAALWLWGKATSPGFCKLLQRCVDQRCHNRPDHTGPASPLVCRAEAHVASRREH